MVGSRSRCQVQRKATKGKPALPTPVRHTEGAKCCFERFIIETIMWYCQWRKSAFETNLEGQNLSETAFNPFSSIFCLWALALLPSFSPPPLQQDLPFHLVSSWTWIQRLKDDNNYVSSKRLTWRTGCMPRPDREQQWSHRWELAGQSCPPPQCSCLLETFDPFLELFHTLTFSSSRYGLSQAGGIRLRPPVSSRLPRWWCTGVNRCNW